MNRSLVTDGEFSPISQAYGSENPPVFFKARGIVYDSISIQAMSHPIRRKNRRIQSG
jgi:hypothetical protein